MKKSHGSKLEARFTGVSVLKLSNRRVGVYKALCLKIKTPRRRNARGVRRLSSTDVHALPSVFSGHQTEGTPHARLKARHKGSDCDSTIGGGVSSSDIERNQELENATRTIPIVLACLRCSSEAALFYHTRPSTPSLSFFRLYFRPPAIYADYDLDMFCRCNARESFLFLPS